MMSVLVVISVAFGVARFVVPVTGRVNKADIFKDLAHIWVGLLLGVAIVMGDWWWSLPVGLTVLEVVAFAARRAE